MEDKTFVMKQGTNKLVIGYFGSDLYWIMLDYQKNNKFEITNNQAMLYEGLQIIFEFMEMRQEPELKCNIFYWVSEARLPEESNHMTISKLKGKFVVEFFQNPNDHISAFSKTCAICFCLNGSRNSNVATMFSILAQKLLAGN